MYVEIVPSNSSLRLDFKLQKLSVAWCEMQCLEIAWKRLRWGTAYTDTLLLWNTLLQWTEAQLPSTLIRAVCGCKSTPFWSISCPRWALLSNGLALNACGSWGHVGLLLHLLVAYSLGWSEELCLKGTDCPIWAPEGRLRASCFWGAWSSCSSALLSSPPISDAIKGGVFCFYGKEVLTVFLNSRSLTTVKLWVFFFLLELLFNCFFLQHCAPLQAGKAFRKFLPLFDRVLVERCAAETVTKGGIMIPEKAQGKVLQATVVAVGSGARGKVSVWNISLGSCKMVVGKGWLQCKFNDLWQKLRGQLKLEVQVQRGSPLQFPCLALALHSSLPLNICKMENICFLNPAI